MAEQFYGRHRAIRLSNGGGEVFLETLTFAGREAASDPEERAMGAFLEDRLGQGRGNRGFDLDSPSPEIAAPERRLALARITAACARRLAVREAGMVAQLPVKEDLVHVLARMVILYEMISDSLPDGAPSLDLDLSPQDSFDVRIAILWQDWLYVRVRSDLEEQLSHLDRIAGLLSAAELTEAHRSSLLNCHSERERIFRELSDRENQISALREIVALASDDEYRRVTEEEIAEILGAGGENE